MKNVLPAGALVALASPHTMKRILIVEANAGPPGSLSQLAARAFPAAQVVHTSSATVAASKMDRLVSMLLVANTLNLAADIAAMAEALRLLVGGSAHIYAARSACCAWCCRCSCRTAPTSAGSNG